MHEGRHFLYALNISPSWSEPHQPDSGTFRSTPNRRRLKVTLRISLREIFSCQQTQWTQMNILQNCTPLCVGMLFMNAETTAKVSHIYNFSRTADFKPVVKTIRRRPKASIMDHPDVSYKVVHRNGGCATAPEEIKALRIHYEFQFPKRYSWSTEHSRSKSSSHNHQSDRKIK